MQFCVNSIFEKFISVSERNCDIICTCTFLSRGDFAINSILWSDDDVNEVDRRQNIN